VPARTANRLHNEIHKFRTPKKHSGLIPYNADSRPGYGSRIKIHTVVSLCPGIETRPKIQRMKCFTAEHSTSPTKFWNYQTSLSDRCRLQIWHEVRPLGPTIFPQKKSTRGEKMKIQRFLVSATEESEWSVTRSTSSYLVQKSWYTQKNQTARRPFTVRQVTPTVLRFFPVSIIPPLLHTRSFIYHPRCIMFFYQYFRFPLSVSFHHCSILIHSSTTNAV